MYVNVWVNSMFNVWYGTDGWMGTPDMTWVMDDASVRDAGGARGRTNTTTVMVMVMVTTSSCSGSGVAAVRTRTTTRLSRRSSSSSVASSHHRGRRCARSAGEIGETTTTNDGEDDEAAKKKWKPKPLPSTFGDTGSVKKKSPFDATTGATSPFERKPTPAGKPDGSPFGAAAAAADKPASPFGAAAATTTGATPAGKKPESPFGAAEARSPFAPAPGAAATKSPFGGSSAAKNPFNEPDAALYGSKPVVKEPEVKVEEKKSVWESMPKPSLGQVVIVLSFTTIISLMLGTFYVVFQAGGVHFNDS